jgi:thiamine pyrophosphokinase
VDAEQNTDFSISVCVFVIVDVSRSLLVQFVGGKFDKHSYSLTLLPVLSTLSSYSLAGVSEDQKHTYLLLYDTYICAGSAKMRYEALKDCRMRSAFAALDVCYTSCPPLILQLKRSIRQ